MSVSTERIIVNPAICGGKPIIAGQRVTVQTILEYLSAGDSVDEILLHYPTLTREDVLACLAFAAEVLSRESCTVPLAA